MIVAAGFHAVAPDLRGFGQTDAPREIESYSTKNRAGGCDRLARRAERRKVRSRRKRLGQRTGLGGCAALSRTYRNHVSPEHCLRSARRRAADGFHRKIRGGHFNFALHFQKSGVAETEFEKDVKASIRRFLYAFSGEAPPGITEYLFMRKPAGREVLEGMPEPKQLPAWLTDADLEYYAKEYGRRGFRGALNMYRNMDKDWKEPPQVGTGEVKQPVLFMGEEEKNMNEQNPSLLANKKTIGAYVLCALSGAFLLGCATALERNASAPATAPSTKEVEMKPVRSAYAEVNGIKLYYEVYGSGEPLVLIHGGLTTIGEMQGWVQLLAKTRQVIAVEMQGHGHTADTDRPMNWPTMGDDVAALLNHLKIPQADLAGHSFGGAAALRAAIQHPDKVRRLVVISSPHARSAWYPETQQGMSQVGAAMAESLKQKPIGKLSQQWPEPQRFPQFLDKFGKMMSEDYDWSADIAKLPMPVLLMFADNDAVPTRHIAGFFALLGGGVKEPGWQNTQLSKSRLAIVPGYSHYNFITSAEAPQIVGKFLAAP